MFSNVISLNSILGMLEALSADNKKWLASKLIESAIVEGVEGEKEGIMSSTCMDTSVNSDFAAGSDAEGINWDKENKRMWNKIAKHYCCNQHIRL